MVLSEYACEVGEEFFEQGDGFVLITRRTVRTGEVVACCECLGVVFSEDKCLVGEECFVECDGLVDITSVPAAESDVVAC